MNASSMVHLVRFTGLFRTLRYMRSLNFFKRFFGKNGCRTLLYKISFKDYPQTLLTWIITSTNLGYLTISASKY